MNENQISQQNLYLLRKKREGYLVVGETKISNVEDDYSTFVVSVIDKRAGRVGCDLEFNRSDLVELAKAVLGIEPTIEERILKELREIKERLQSNSSHDV